MSRNGTSIFSVVGAGVGFQTTLTISTGTYAAGAVLGGAMTVPVAERNGGRAYIYSVELAGQTTANPYEAWVFNADLVTPAADAALLALAAADAAKFLGVIDIPATAYRTPGSGFTPATVTGAGLTVKTTANTSNVIVYLKNVAASTGGVTALTVTINADHMD
jgi:hypothetical protein